MSLQRLEGAARAAAASSPFVYHVVNIRDRLLFFLVGVCFSAHHLQNFDRRNGPATGATAAVATVPAPSVAMSFLAMSAEPHRRAVTGVAVANPVGCVLTSKRSLPLPCVCGTRC